MLAYLGHNGHYSDFNQCRPQKIMKKNIPKPIFRVKSSAEQVTGVKKCKAIVIDGKKSI